MEMKIGCHVSISGGLVKAISRAKKRSCNVFQIFSGNPRTWLPWKPDLEEVKRFKKEIKESALPAPIIHAPYLINLAADSDSTFQKSIQRITTDLEITDILGSNYYLFHLGSRGSLSIESSLARIVDGLKQVLSNYQPKAMILLENTAGSGQSVGYTFNQIKYIINQLPSSLSVGICLDTCHAFAAGYDLTSPLSTLKTIQKLDEIIGLSYLKVLHINDSFYPKGSRKDRHADIGKGFIGVTGFKALLRIKELAHLPLILETPSMSLSADLRNISLLRKIYQA
jgi:deoxyribonuclease-4